jgi:uncharacterized membrane protein YjgN (DUF898 family)
MIDQDAFATPAAAPAAPQRFQVEFTGTGGEYFRIWIVNLLLTIVTLGIYSAWAKVRKMQYFYRNTRVDGAIFDYHGRPWAILKGRIIVLVLVIAYNLSFQFSLVAGFLVALALALAMPWLLVQSQRFRLHNSSYRGLRFRFLGTVGEAYAIYGIPLLVLLGVAGMFVHAGIQAQRGVEPGMGFISLVVLANAILFLLWPYLHYRFKRYQHANSAFGNTRSVFTGKASRFYVYYAIAAAMLLGAAVLVFGSIGLLGARRGGGAVFAMIVGVVLFYVVLLALAPYLAARIQNHVWRSTRLGPVGFESAVQARRLIWIVLSNLVLIVLTLGLFTPFAAVRAERYKLQSKAVLADDDLASFVGVSASEVTAVGEGAADLFDVDFAL